MSGSDSDSDSNKIKNWPFKCTCKCGAANCLDDSYTDCDDTESEESFSIDNKKTIFISIFNNKTQRNKNLISDTVEIKNYREQYQKLPLKNVNNIKKIWADVKVDMPLLGQVPLKCIDNELTEVKKDKYSHKKKLKKPTHLMQNKLSADSPANNSQQSVVADKSHKIVQPVVKQVHEKLPQAQINKNNNKDTKIKKANESILKGATKNTTSNENKNPKNEPKLSDKLTQSVKPHIIKDNLKPNTGKTVNSNSNALTSIQPIIENNSTNNISNISNKKSNNRNNSVKVDTIKTPVKAVVENKIKKNEENKKKTIADSCLPKEESKEEMKIAKINLSTQSYTKSISKVKSENSNSGISNMKSSAEDKTVKVDNLVKSEAKINTENREKTNLVELNSKSNTENKIVKDESINLNVESDVESETLNNNLNKKLKLEVIEFIIPNSNKIIPSSNRNEKEKSANDKNLQSNKKLSKKQKKKMRQKEKNLGANVKDISTSNSRDLSMSSSKSFDDKKSKNNSNKNVKEEAAKAKKKELNNTDKDKTKNKKLIELEHSEQDTEEFEIEEMNSITQKKKKQAKTKPVTETQTKNNSKKNNEQEKLKIYNEQEFTTVITRKRQHLPISDNKDCIIYSEKYAEQGAKLILDNNLMGALQCITAAIDYNQSDYRHYLNRCYCFLRMKQPVFALADAQYVIRLCTNIGHLFIANLRAGQAAYALQDYKQAEYFLKEATRMDPENYHAQRELLRVKISHIISLGFNEKDALMALQKYPSVLEAISYLNKSQKNSSISKFNNNFDIRDYNCDDMVFSSGDEEESENFETFNRMLNYQPGKVKILHLVAKPVKSELLGGFSNCDKDNKLHINLKPKRKFVPTNKSANDKAIWVGSLTNDITEQMLKKKFKQFGNVISVYRPCNEAYAFINFEKSEDVTNTLINTSAHEIAGIKLAVRSALRQK